MDDSADSDGPTDPHGPTDPDTFVPLDAYGLVGNAETAALVSDRGSVDWFPYPQVHSESVFAAILDDDGGGHFAIAPTDDYDSAQSYRDRTNVLETSFRTPEGRATVTDFMPVRTRDYPDGTPDRALYRRVTGEEGSVTLRAEFAPAFDYARTTPDLTRVARSDAADIVRATGDEDDPDLLFSAPRGIEVRGDRAVAELSVDADEECWFVVADERPTSDPQAVLDGTVDHWREWVHDCENEAECPLEGPWHDEVVRSGLVLKLLTHHATGAIAAAPTTSLPETVGGERNWDYRYNWLRDAAFTAQALYNLDHEAEAREYLDWFVDLCRNTTDPEDLQPLYGLDGEADLDERELTHLSGYRYSSPVRVGNDAHEQLQLDIYGELADAFYEISRYGRKLERDDWLAVRDLVDYVCEVWDEPDAGIWEFRTEPRHFVYSKVMCWVALDRGIEMVDETDFDGPRDRWERVRTEVRETVLDRGYDEEVGSFVQSFDDDDLDATGLLLPMVGFLPFDDDRVQNTIDAVIDRLEVDHGLVMRYEDDDGFPEGEGAFALCSFWLVNALALSGRTAEARERYEAALENVSPVGLLSEEIDPETGDHLGNTPQAFSHVGLINSALYLGRTSGCEQTGPEPKGCDESPAVDGERLRSPLVDGE